MIKSKKNSKEFKKDIWVAVNPRWYADNKPLNDTEISLFIAYIRQALLGGAKFKLELLLYNKKIYVVTGSTLKSKELMRLARLTKNNKEWLKNE